MIKVFGAYCLGQKTMHKLGHCFFCPLTWCILISCFQKTVKICKLYWKSGFKKSLSFCQCLCNVSLDRYEILNWSSKDDNGLSTKQCLQIFLHTNAQTKNKCMHTFCQACKSLLQLSLSSNPHLIPNILQTNLLWLDRWSVSVFFRKTESVGYSYLKIGKGKSPKNRSYLGSV